MATLFPKILSAVAVAAISPFLGILNLKPIMLLLSLDRFVITLLLQVITLFGSGNLLFSIVEAPHRASWTR